MTETKPFTEPHEAAFHRAYLEGMRNMATVVAYALGASFLIHKAPVLLGSHWCAWVAGIALYVASLGGAFCAVDQLVNALITRHPGLRRRRRFFVIAMLTVALIFIALPWYMTFFYGTS
jgi:hypothetical protein